MNMRLFGKAILYAGAILIFGAMALAQSTKGSNPPPPKKDAPSAQPADRKSGAVIAADFKSTGQSSSERGRDIPSVSEVTVTAKTGGQPTSSRGRDIPSVSEVTVTAKTGGQPTSGRGRDNPSISEVTAGAKTSGQASSDREGEGPIISEVTATDKKEGQAAAFPSFKSMGSAHATEAVAPQPHQGKNELDQLYDKNPNPPSTSEAREGVNPLFEAKDKDAVAAAPKPSNQAHSHETVEYKDPEDMTTRYRPGNNKTTKDNNPPQKGSPSKQ